MWRMDFFIKKERRLVHSISQHLETVASIAILLIMCVTCIDIIGAKLLKWRLFGAIDLVMLSQSVAISLAGGATLLAGRHVAVEFFLRVIPQRFKKPISVFINLMLITFVCLAIWRLALLGYSFYKSGDHSATANIPLFPFPFIIAIGLIAFILRYAETIWGNSRKT